MSHASNFQFRARLRRSFQVYGAAAKDMTFLLRSGQVRELLDSSFEGFALNPTAASYLPTFKLSDFDGAPSFGCSNERTEHQFQNGSLAKDVGDDLEAATLLDKQPFK
jgi:hypothetical protein